MKIALHPANVFWGLMNPNDLVMTLTLSEIRPTAEIDETKLLPWELKQIVRSVKDNRISISVQVEDLLKSKSETPKKETDSKSLEKDVKTGLVDDSSNKEVELETKKSEETVVVEKEKKAGRKPAANKSKE